MTEEPIAEDLAIEPAPDSDSQPEAEPSAETEPDFAPPADEPIIAPAPDDAVEPAEPAESPDGGLDARLGRVGKQDEYGYEGPEPHWVQCSRHFRPAFSPPGNPGQSNESVAGPAGMEIDS